MMQSNKKVAIITGATKGIGRSTVIKFLENNIKCVLVARKKNQKLLTLLNKKFSSENFLFIKADISKLQSIKKIINATNKKFKRIDILFNNAAYSDFNYFFKNNIKMYNKIFDTNVKGMFFFTSISCQRNDKKKN